MKTIYEHTQAQILVIPQALFCMQDVRVLAQSRQSVIFYKSLAHDLRNIEFYTNSPCFIFIENGTEVITNQSHESVTLQAGDAIFFPQGLSLHSDFVKETRSLNAYLVFFDPDIIVEYLRRSECAAEQENVRQNYLTIRQADGFAGFFQSINYAIQTEAYLQLKLQELLFLIAEYDVSASFNALLSTMQHLPPRQNLQKLLDTVDAIELTVRDLAQLSGRSLSTFNREFKSLYNMTAKQWLQNHRLERAKQLLESGEYSVTDVSAMIGYVNVSHFIRTFKTRFGMTPKSHVAAQLIKKR